MWRMSWRRRLPNSSFRMGPHAFELVERQLGARAHELAELREVALAGVGLAARLELRARDVGEVAQEFSDVARLRDRGLRGAGADAVEEATAPGGERRDPLAERRGLFRKERRELEVVGAERRERRGGQALHVGVRRRVLAAGIDGEFGEPFLRAVAVAHAERPREPAVGL